MTVRVRRTIELDATPEQVWGFIADPAKRARAISVVDDYTDHGTEGVWHIRLPIPLLRKTISVETEDVVREPPRYVKFVGRSSVMSVVGEHEITETDDGCTLDNRFVVDGRVPGVERFFERNLDSELSNLERALREELEVAT